MINNKCGDSDHQQTRFRLQSEKYSVHSGVEADSAHHDDMRAIGTAVDNMLKLTGFTELARRNCTDYRLERNDVYLPDLPAAFDGYTILHLSDLHADGLVDGGEGIKRIVESVTCDLAVLTGDFRFEACLTCLEALVPIVRSILARDGIFGILGNHDILEMIPMLEQMGVRILLNESIRLHRSSADIVLAGVDDPHYYKCHDLQKALFAVDPDQVVILLSHSPEIAPEASRCGVDFYLCGHTHGGQICLPGGIPVFSNASCKRSYVSGSWNCGAMQGYTNRGTGFSLTAARLFCPPEITLHSLHRGNMPCEFNAIVEENIGSWVNKVGHAVFA
jgi:predicted MPP superfamily phosphohydrolase